MTHPLELNNGLRILSHSILTVQDSLKNASEILRAAHLIEKLEVPKVPEKAPDTFFDEGEGKIELTEPQRDLLKRLVEANASKIPPSKYAVSLLTQLGFEP